MGLSVGDLPPSSFAPFASADLMDFLLEAGNGKVDKTGPPVVGAGGALLLPSLSLKAPSAGMESLVSLFGDAGEGLERD